MRVPNNSISDSLVSQLQGLSSKQSRLQAEAASGQRITKASDDSAAMGRVLNLQAEKQQIQQFGRNNDRAQAVSQSSFTATTQLKQISDRSGELAALGNGVVSPDALNAYGAETDQLLEQALQTANTANGGEFIFGGTKSDVAPFTATRDVNGKITAVAYNGAAAGADFRISEGSTLTPFTSGVENQQFADFANRLVSLRDAFQANDTTAVTTARAGLSTSEDDLLGTISNIGAKQTRLEADSTQNAARFADLEKLTSSEVDADLAQTVVKLTQAQTSYQAALQSGAKFLQLSLMDYVR